MENYQKYFDKIGSKAIQSILFEVLISPKPGLVDRFNNGIHKDMNIYTFITSASTLPVYFKTCLNLGFNHSDSLHKLFIQLREAGKRAEDDMFCATNGINTHKGAIFIFGLVLGAIGYQKRESQIFSLDELTKTISLIAHEAMSNDLKEIKSKTISQTAGEKLYKQESIKGIRGSALNGFEVVLKNIIPFYQKLRTVKELQEDKFYPNDIFVNLFLYIISETEDTNIIKKHGLPWFNNLKKRIKTLYSDDFYYSTNSEYGVKVLNELSGFFEEHRISPGGSADITALTIFYIELFEGDF